MSDLWAYRSTTWRADKILGYAVEALDGAVGRVDEATGRIEGSYLRYVVVDTGASGSGKKIVLPASVVDRIDRANRAIHVERTKDDIVNGPEYDEAVFDSATYRAEIGRYYGPGGAGYREPGPTGLGSA